MHDAAVNVSEHPRAEADDAPLCSADASGVEMHEPLCITARANRPRAVGEVISAHTE